MSKKKKKPTILNWFFNGKNKNKLWFSFIFLQSKHTNIEGLQKTHEVKVIKNFPSMIYFDLEIDQSWSCLEAFKMGLLSVNFCCCSISFFFIFFLTG